MYTVCELLNSRVVRMVRGEERDHYQLSLVKLLIQLVRKNLCTSGNLKNL